MQTHSCCGCTIAMSSAEAGGYGLTPCAEADLEEVWRYTAESWSVAQADTYIRDLVRTFELIASMPMMAREHKEFDPPVRIHLHRSHVVVYVIEGAGVSVVRVLGGRQDWAAILNAAES